MKALKILVFFVILVGYVCCGIYVSAEMISGDCGADAVWRIEDNVLTITGSGTIDNGDEWITYCESITKIDIGNGITDIGAYVFADCRSITELILPETVKSIGSRAFNNCSSLERIVIPDSVTDINKTAFNNCDKVVVFCNENSYANEFADAYSFSYRIIGEVNVIFDANGGSDPPDTLTGRTADNIIIPPEHPTKSGYIFSGWAQSSQASESVFNAGDTICLFDDMTLYAVWLNCELLPDSNENLIYIYSETSFPLLKLWIAAYKGDKLLDVKIKDIQLNSGENCIETDVNWSDLDRDRVAVFLWDESLRPYASDLNVAMVRDYTVTFLDWNNKVVSSQVVSSGMNAEEPASPFRDGYEFCGWSGNYINVVSDETVTAQYIDLSHNNVFKIFDVTANKGSTFKTMVYLGGMVEVCGFDMRLKYDSDNLELININTDFDLDVIANHVSSDSIVKFNFGSSKNKIGSAKIMELEFKIKDTSELSTVISLTPIEVIKADSAQNNIPVETDYILVNGVVNIK